MTHILDMCVRCNLMNSLRILLSTHAKDTTLTFLVSIWSDEACSTSLRLTTLEMTQQLLAFGVAKRVDFQVLLPSFLVGLASADSRMRSGVFTCMESVASIYASNKSKKKDKASLSVKADLKIFGASDDSFYGVHCGAKQSLLFLETSDVATLIRDLRGEREAVIADVNHLHKWVVTYFNNPSKAVAEYVLGNGGVDCTSSILSATSISFLHRHFFATLCSHISTCSKVTFRAALLRILDPVDSKRKLKAVVPILSTLLPYLDALLADADCDTAQFELLCSVVRCFGASAASKKSYVEAIIALMKSMQTANTGSQTRSECLINEIVRSCEAMFEHVDQDQRAVILHTLLELVIALPGSLSVAINKLLVRLPMDSALVEGELRRAIDDLSKGSSSEQAAKKTRYDGRNALTSWSTFILNNHHHSGTAVLAHALSSVTSIGELIQVKDNIANEEGLLLPLFETLGVLLLIMATPTEYTRQVLLGNILRLMERASAHGIELDESAFRVDLLIQMIRVTDNPQTHNHALLLLAAIGAAYPEKVLHNMMPVFTFMGASVLRQDDNYSFHVIQRTLETILPALVAKNRVGQDGAPSIRAVLEVFANALYHIPKHRRLRLFTILVSTLGPEKFLASVLELLLVRHAVVNPQPTSASGKSNIEEPVTAFCSSLLNQYEIPLQVCAFIEMVKSATSLTSAKMIGQRIQSRTVLSWLECIGSQLSDSFFLSRVAVADQSTMQQLYKQMMETVLTLLNGVQSISSIADADSKTKANAAQVMDASMVVIDKTLVLLTSVSFVEIMCGLIEHSSSAVRQLMAQC